MRQMGRMGRLHRLQRHSALHDDCASKPTDFARENERCMKAQSVHQQGCVVLRSAIGALLQSHHPERDSGDFFGDCGVPPYFLFFALPHLD